jgi:inosose dehydratase
MIKFAYSTINWGDTCDLRAAFDEIRQTGWGAVELFGHSLEWLGTPRRLAGLFEGLKPATLFGSVDLPSSDRQRTIHKNRIDFCAEIGATAYGLVGAGRPRSRPPNDAEMRDLADLCDDLAAHGAALGVAVAYHPHTRCTVQYEHEIDQLMALTKHLTLCLDVSHIAVVGEDPLAHIRKYRGRIGYLHLKDWGQGDFVELGRGIINIDFAACLRELEAQQFGGWVVIEQSTSEVSARHSAELNAAYLKGLGYAINA